MYAHTYMQQNMLGDCVNCVNGQLVLRVALLLQGKGVWIGT